MKKEGIFVSIVLGDHSPQLDRPIGLVSGQSVLAGSLKQCRASHVSMPVSKAILVQ